MIANRFNSSIILFVFSLTILSLISSNSFASKVPKAKNTICEDHRSIAAIIKATKEILEEDKISYNDLDDSLDLLNAYCSKTVWKKPGNIYSCGGSYTDVGKKRVFVGSKYVVKVHKACESARSAFLSSPKTKGVLEFDKFDDILSINWNLIDRKSNKVGIIEE